MKKLLCVVFLTIVAICAFAFVASADGPSITFREAQPARESVVVSFAEDDNLWKIGLADPILPDSEVQRPIVLKGLVEGAVYEISFDHFRAAVGAEDMGSYAYVRFLKGVEFTIEPCGGTYEYLGESWQKIALLTQPWGVGWEVAQRVTVTLTAPDSFVVGDLGVGAEWAVGAPHMVEAFFGDFSIEMVAPPPPEPCVVVEEHPVVVEPAPEPAAVECPEVIAEPTVPVTPTVEPILPPPAPTTAPDLVAEETVVEPEPAAEQPLAEEPAETAPPMPMVTVIPGLWEYGKCYAVWFTLPDGTAVWFNVAEYEDGWLITQPFSSIQ